MTDDESGTDATIDHRPSNGPRPAGRVTLVGAGPGDPDLLTIAAAKAIARADVILVDDLVDRRVLDHARADARIVEVGKRGRFCRAGDPRGERRSTPQAFIERLMRIEARRGSHVVRLKGGDPYVFGRGGEERRHLIEHGIAVDVIPGISSGIAAPGVVGIPVTHRDYSAGVVLVTGHRLRDDRGHAADVDWAALAATGLTLVVYMGVARCEAIVDALVAGGKAPSTPAAAIQSAHTEREKHVIATLGTLAAEIVLHGIESPAILVIGDVVRCAALVPALVRAEGPDLLRDSA